MMGFPETPDIETSSANYATRFSGPIGHWLLAVQERATLHLIRDLPGARVLDVGGGHGQLTAPLVRAGYKVTVVGSAPVCAERIASFVETGQCQFEVGDILSLPFEDQSFDVVLSYRLVSHVNQWQLLLRELTRMSKQIVM